MQESQKIGEEGATVGNPREHKAIVNIQTAACALPETGNAATQLVADYDNL